VRAARPRLRAPGLGRVLAAINPIEDVEIDLVVTHATTCWRDADDLRATRCGETGSRSAAGTAGDAASPNDSDPPQDGGPKRKPSRPQPSRSSSTYRRAVDALSSMSSRPLPGAVPSSKDGRTPLAFDGDSDPRPGVRLQDHVHVTPRTAPSNPLSMAMRSLQRGASGRARSPGRRSAVGAGKSVPDRRSEDLGRSDAVAALLKPVAGARFDGPRARSGFGPPPVARPLVTP